MTKLIVPATVFLLPVALIAVAAPSAAQQPVRVSSDVVCAECVITIDTVVTLGGLDGEGMEVIAHYSDIAVDPQERILVTHTMHRSVYVFDMAGRFLRTVGREGEGPGEFSMMITHLNAGPEYIHVFEVLNGRTLLDHDFEFVRRDHFPGQVHHSFVTESDVVAFSASIPSAAAVGHKLHFLDLSGEMVSHGAGDAAYHSRASSGAIVTGNEESLWVVEWDSTRISRWDLRPKPTLAGVWDRTVDEWERHDHGTRVWPGPGHTGAMLDESGLWIVWRVPDPDWRGRPRDVRMEGEREVTDPLQDIYDSWVELLDPDTGETLARYFDKEFLPGFVPGSRYVKAYHETEAGVPYIRLLEPRLSRRAGGARER